MALTPDLAGLSLGGAYQAGLLAGFTAFRITAYRATWMVDPDYLFREVAPALGYIAQTSTPGSGGAVTDDTPPEGSFYTVHPEPGVPDQFPEPGEPVVAGMTLCFVYQVSDTHLTPADAYANGLDLSTGVTAWWEYDFAANAIPGSLQADIQVYNGTPRAPVDVEGMEWLAVAVDPLRVFSNPPLPSPADLLADVPQFERQSYEIQAVLRVVGLELARIEAALIALTQNWFPITADLLLTRFEAILGLPINPPTESLQQRRNIVLAYMRHLRTEGRGLDWIATITALCGTNWNYREHIPGDPTSPPAYSVDVNIPMVLARVGWNLVRDVTPAHLVINGGYVEGFLVDDYPATFTVPGSLIDITPL